LANIINGTDTGSGGLITTGDSSDELQLQTAEVARVTLTNTAVVVNESGADVDFRVEGDTDANLLFVDASTDRVGIGTSSPGARLDVTTATAGFAASLTNTNASDSNGLYVKSGTGSTEYNLRLSNTSGSTDFMVVKGNGNVGIGTTSPSVKFEVNGRVLGESVVAGNALYVWSQIVCL
jgi:hypothetical protein